VINEAQLDVRLEQWAKEYGQGGDMPQTRTRNCLQSLIDHRGFVPSARGYSGTPIGTAADEVEQAICTLAQMRGTPGTVSLPFRAAMCLRAYYLSPKHWPENERLRTLAKVGIPMSRQTYYRAVQYGRAFLLGALVTVRAESA